MQAWLIIESFDGLMDEIEDAMYVNLAGYLVSFAV